ncbi:MAG TPA: DnaB-like helicase C-terminal domain-containing protein [Gemmatimonadales bacterium]|nr:DnaB-like helicase C-terminal domain-containing protein [Gemmatimonadales bacterium]
MSDTPTLAFLMRRLEASASGAPAPDAVATGFPSLDQLLSGGIRKGDLALIAGDAGSGKSALALAMAVRAASSGRNVSYLSAESTPDRLVERAIAMEGRFSIDDLRKGRLDEEARIRAANSIQELRNGLPEFGLIPEPRPESVAGELRRALDLEFAVVDGIGGMSAGERPRDEEFAWAIASMKRLALELGIALLVTVPLVRPVTGRDDPRPMLDDLGALGAAKDSPDLVLGLFREEMYHAVKVGIEGAAELMLLKNRNGPVGYVDLYFYSRWMRFEDMLEH